MRKIIISSILMLSSLCSFAQFGITGGLTSSSSSIKTAVSELKSKSLSLYHFGVTYKFGLGNVFAFQPSLLYNVKGATVQDLSGLSDLDLKTGFLELPLQLQAGAGLGKIVRLYGIAEPFIGYALSNNVKSGDTSSSNWDNIKNRFEWGLGLGAGVELFRHIQVGVKYFWNFGSLYGAEISFASIKTSISEGNCRGISLTAAVLF